MTEAQRILDFVTQNGILDLDTIQAQIKMKQRQEYLEMHQNKVWQSASGYWYTELPPGKGETKRRLVKKKNKTDLENAIIDFYEIQAGAPTFESCFFECMHQKVDYKEITQGTFDRYEQDFNRFIKPTYLAGRKVDMITEDELEEFIRKRIADLELTAKAYSNMRTIIRATLLYAKKNHYTKLSAAAFFGDLELSKRAFAKKQRKPQVFKEEEQDKLLEWLRDHPTVENYGLILTFQTGMRTAELAALKYSDIYNDADGQWIRIERQEVKYRHPETRQYTYEVVEYPKTDAGCRSIGVTDVAKETLAQIRRLNPNGEYLMERNGEKFKKQVFNRRLYRACTQAGVDKKSMHKIRKTFGTTLIDSGVDEIIITDQMGHVDIATTKEYYYESTKNKKKKLEQLNHAITK